MNYLITELNVITLFDRPLLRWSKLQRVLAKEYNNDFRAVGLQEEVKQR